MELLGLMLSSVWLPPGLGDEGNANGECGLGCSLYQGWPAPLPSHQVPAPDTLSFFLLFSDCITTLRGSEILTCYLGGFIGTVIHWFKLG